MTTDVRQLAAQIQQALGLSVVCGSLTLNFNNGDLQSVKTETYQRVKPEIEIDKGFAPRAHLTRSR